MYLFFSLRILEVSDLVAAIYQISNLKPELKGFSFKNG